MGLFAAADTLGVGAIARGLECSLAWRAPVDAAVQHAGQGDRATTGELVS